MSFNTSAEAQLSEHLVFHPELLKSLFEIKISQHLNMSSIAHLKTLTKIHERLFLPRATYSKLSARFISRNKGWKCQPSRISSQCGMLCAKTLVSIQAEWKIKTCKPSSRAYW